MEKTFKKTVRYVSQKLGDIRADGGPDLLGENVAIYPAMAVTIVCP
jgi:hypothetical protein